MVFSLSPPIARTLPVSERIAERVLSLPIYPELTGDQIERVVDVIAAAEKYNT